MLRRDNNVHFHAKILDVWLSKSDAIFLAYHQRETVGIESHISIVFGSNL